MSDQKVIDKDKEVKKHYDRGKMQQKANFQNLLLFYFLAVPLKHCYFVFQFNNKHTSVKK